MHLDALVEDLGDGEQYLGLDYGIDLAAHLLVFFEHVLARHHAVLQSLRPLRHDNRDEFLERHLVWHRRLQLALEEVVPISLYKQMFTRRFDVVDVEEFLHCF